MKHRTSAFIGGAFLLLTTSSCSVMGSMMAPMMGMGDKMNAMKNEDKIIAMSPDEMKKYANAKEQAAWEHGKEMFNDPELAGAKMGVSCNSCHPGGGTTGGEAQVPMRKFKMPIPTLIGAAGTFPKYKIPNDEVITLQQMDNNCNRMFMGGNGLQLNATDAWDLEKYVASLSNGEAVSVGGQMADSDN